MGKRAFDLLAAVFGLVLLSPVFVVVAVLIRLDSPGGVFFRQVRVGRGGRPFRIFKFRTMVADAPTRGASITVEGDHRITRVGAFLRRYKLDEFPQLLNVVAGHMSLVGPRPEVPEMVAHYTGAQRAVLSVRPGITDYASVTYRDENEVLAQSSDPIRTYIDHVMPRKLELNLLYLARRSLAEDVRVILVTVYLSLRGLLARTGKIGQAFVDGFFFAAGLALAYLAHFEFDLPAPYREQLVLVLPGVVAARLVTNAAFGVYRVLWTCISLNDVPRFLGSIATVSALLFVVGRVSSGTDLHVVIPFGVIALDGALGLSGVLSVRLLGRALHEAAADGVVPVRDDADKVLILGAGRVGRMTARQIRLHANLNMVLVGFLDDDEGKRGSRIEGARVLGSLDDLDRVFDAHRVSTVFLSIGALPTQRRRELAARCTELGVRLRDVPGVGVLIAPT